MRAPRPLRAVIFDMDGTITIPTLDFAQWRRDLSGVRAAAAVFLPPSLPLTGILSQALGVQFAPHVDILTQIDALSPESRRRGHELVHELESEGAKRMRLQRGSVEVFDALDRAGIPRAVVTRNSQVHLDVLHEHLEQAHGLPPFAIAVGREFKPVKPAPAPAVHVMKHMQVDDDPSAVWFVGDSADDLLCAQVTIFHFWALESSKSLVLQAAHCVPVLVRNLHPDVEERYLAHARGVEQLGLHQLAVDTMEDLLRCARGGMRLVFSLIFKHSFRHIQAALAPN